MATVETPAAPNSPVNDEWREKVKRWYIQLKGLGWEGMMLDKVMKQNAIARDTALRAASGTLGQPGATPSLPEEDDMGIRIGDEVHNHYALPAPSAPQASPGTASATAPAPAESKSTLSTVLKAGALIVAGSALGSAGPMVVNAVWPSQETTIVQPPPAIDTSPSPSLSPGEVTVTTRPGPSP